MEADGLRALYKAKHTNAFWADFGDFTYFRMINLRAVNFVGGFARAGSIKPGATCDDLNRQTATVANGCDMPIACSPGCPCLPTLATLDRRLHGCDGRPDPGVCRAGDATTQQRPLGLR